MREKKLKERDEGKQRGKQGARERRSERKEELIGGRGRRKWGQRRKKKRERGRVLQIGHAREKVSCLLSTFS